VPEIELPDRILAFMENNDLPVFINKKQYNTVRCRDPVSQPRHVNIKVGGFVNWASTTQAVKAKQVVTDGTQTSARPRVSKNMTLELER